MMNDPVNPNHIGDDSVASTRMTTQSYPPSLAPKTAQRASLGHRLQRALTGGPNRRFPGLHPSPGGAASLSPFLNRRLGFPILALLALLAASLLFLLPGGPLHAQDATIDYAENETIPVATFTGSDPEGRPVYWSLAPADADPDGAGGDLVAADAAEMTHFSISANGVLSFNFPPDYEAPPTTNSAARNTYRVVVVAADEPLGAANRVLGYEKVTVNVTDEDEGGEISLDAQQPQENEALTATLIDDDASIDQNMAAKWKWEHSESKGGPWTAILTATSAEYTPLGVADKYLRATATYTDGHGSDKNAQEVTPHMVRAVPAANNANPVFPDEDTVASGIQVVRKVDENSRPGTKVGDPVLANDAPGDVLTYTFSGGANDSSYRIDPATGQITTGPRTALDREGNGGTHTVNVTATDPAGGATEQVVTITINDVNEAPMITVGNTKVSVDENADATAQAAAAPTYVAYPEVSTTNCAIETCAWSLKGPDAGDFNIGNQAGGTLGQLTFKEAPNYEAPADANGDNVYMVTVVVTDAGIEGKGKLSAERDVVVTVDNVNEPIEAEAAANPVVTLSSLVPKVGVPLTATLDDPDGGEKGIEWQWSIQGATDLAARPNGEISGAESATYTPKADDVGGRLTAMVTYADAVGSDQTGTAVAANDVVADLAAKAPEFDPKPTSRSVPENYESGDNYGDPQVTYPNVGAVVTATDPNDDTMTYSLGGTDAGSFDIDQGTGQISVKAATKLNLEAKATYRVTVTATDPGDLSDSVDVTIKLTDVDEGPEIAGDDVSRDYRENGTGSVATLRATDPEGRRPVYWSLLSTGTPGDITANDYAEQAHFSISANGVLSFNFPPDYEAPPTTNSAARNTYRVVVVAADEPLGAANRVLSYKKVTVNVTNLDETETVTLSLRQAQVGTAVTATYNDLDNETPDGTSLTWKWYLGGLEIPDVSTATFTPTNSGSHRAEASYTKTDGSKKAASATITVRATPDAPNVVPRFPTGSDRRSVDENSPPATRVGSAVTATDPGDVLTYTFSGGANDSSYRIDPATGQITTGPRTALDREGNGGTHTVNVTATDPAGGATEQVVTITINDVNEAPMITVGNTKVSVDENADATAQAAAAPTYVAYPEVSTTNCAIETCAWSLKGPDAGDFNIGNQAGGTLGQLTFKEAPNYEAPADANGDNVYMVTVVVTDAGIEGKGKLSAERDVVVTVDNVNEPIEAEAAANPVVTLSSLVPKVGVPLTATLDDPDGGEKGIEWQWSIQGATDLAARPNGEISGAESATYTPKADDVGGRLTAMVTYADAVGSDQTGTAVAANDVVADLAAKAPEFDPKPTSRSVPENYESGDNYGDPQVTYPNVGAVVTATDPNDDTMTYSLGGTDAGSFDIDQGTGQISVKAATKLNLEAKATYRVTVTATDPGDLSDSVDVTIKLTDVDEGPTITRTDALTNQAPTFPSAATTREVAENTVAGEDIGAPVAATDADNDALTYALSGTDAASFDIISATGQLQTKAALDHETKDSYTVTVTASDSGGLSDSIDVTITVTDVNEAPVAPTVANQTATKDTAFSYTVPAFTDPEGGTITYTATLSDDSALPGWLSFNASTRELSGTPLEADTPASLTIEVSATDDGSPSASAQVTFTLTVGEEAPATLLVRYDADKDGWIQLKEARVAVGDYFGPPKGVKLSLADTRKVVGLYFEYKNRP